MVIILTEMEFSVFDFASCMSEAIDLVSHVLNDHHKKVAYIAYKISTQMKLPDPVLSDIVLAAILHDIGVVTNEQRVKLTHFSFADDSIGEHALVGYQLLQGFEPLKNSAEIIKHHHASYEKSNDEIPLGSYIIHLADRLAVALNDKAEILEQVPGIMEKVEANSSIFHPDAVVALRALAKLDFFWIEACSIPMSYTLPERMQHMLKIIDIDSIRDFAKLVANFIDYRSRFTSTHSSGVAAVALELTKLSGFSERECTMMEIAGFLHDIGKLAISNDILEKNGALSFEEVNEMRKHTYYTYMILNRIKGLEQIASWAAFHHEKINGNGYPFHIKGEDFSKLARIMAVADIFTAITEDRPYRTGMSSGEAMRVLSNMADNGSIDGMIVSLVQEHFSSINNLRARAQEEALIEYRSLRAVGVG